MRPKIETGSEGAFVLAAAAGGYALLGASWGLFVGLLLVPDAFMAGYLAGPRVGAAVYNAGHTYLVPLALGSGALATGGPLLGAVALIWAAHIGMDRALGYGLKRPSGFRDTHLDDAGPARPPGPVHADTRAQPPASTAPRPGGPGAAPQEETT